MAVSKKHLFMSYILNQLTRLEQDVQEQTAHIRYRKIDTVDCLELVIAIERLQCFKEFANNAISLLKLDEIDCESLDSRLK